MGAPRRESRHRGTGTAGILAVITRVLSITRLGPLPVPLPTVIWMFSVADPLPAPAWLIWSTLVQLIGDVLLPMPSAAVSTCRCW